MQNTLVGYYLEIFLPVGMEIGMEVSYFALHAPDNIIVKVLSQILCF